jgi:hypothetical protein
MGLQKVFKKLDFDKKQILRNFFSLREIMIQNYSILTNTETNTSGQSIHPCKHYILYIKLNRGVCVCVFVCLCVCVSGIEIHTVGPILTKFGMGAQLYKGQVIGYVSAPRVDPRGQGAQNRVWRASTAATVRLGKKFIKQKL